MKLLWMIVSGVCIAAAAFLLIRGELNIAFVFAVLGIVAWFLNYRMQMKAIIDTADSERSMNEVNEREELDGN